VKDIYVPHDNSEPGKQLVFILGNPLKYVEILTRTFFEKHDSYIISCIGDLGWMDTSLTKWHTMSFLITVVIVSLLDNEKGVAIHLRDKIIVIILLATNVILICTALYLSWTPLGDSTIGGIQGRYFIPLVPLFLLLLYRNGNTSNSHKFNFLIPLYSLISLTVTCLVQ